MSKEYNLFGKYKTKSVKESSFSQTCRKTVRTREPQSQNPDKSRILKPRKEYI